MNTVEEQLLSQFDALLGGTGPDEVRRAVADLRGRVDALDPAQQADRAVRALYLYVEAACRQGSPKAAGEQSEIENSLAAVLDVARRDASAHALTCLSGELDELAARIDELPMWERNIVGCLLFYVEEKVRQALDLAVRGTWGTPAALWRLEMDRADAAAEGVREAETAGR